MKHKIFTWLILRKICKLKDNQSPYKSYMPGRVLVGTGIQWSSIPTTSPLQAWPKVKLRASSKYLLNTDVLGTWITSLGSLFQFENTHSKGMLPNSSEPPLTQPWGIASCSINGSQEEEISSSLFTSPPHEPAESKEVILLPSFLQAKQAQSPKQLLTGHSFPSFQQLCCTLLNAFKDLYTRV